MSALSCSSAPGCFSGLSSLLSELRGRLPASHKEMQLLEQYNAQQEARIARLEKFMTEQVDEIKKLAARLEESESINTAQQNEMNEFKEETHRMLGKYNKELCTKKAFDLMTRLSKQVNAPLFAQNAETTIYKICGSMIVKDILHENILHKDIQSAFTIVHLGIKQKIAYSDIKELMNQCILKEAEADPLISIMGEIHQLTLKINEVVDSKWVDEQFNMCLLPLIEYMHILCINDTVLKHLKKPDDLQKLEKIENPTDKQKRQKNELQEIYNEFINTVFDIACINLAWAYIIGAVTRHMSNKENDPTTLCRQLKEITLKGNWFITTYSPYKSKQSKRNIKWYRPFYHGLRLL
jgi:hypothetical protein